MKYGLDEKPGTVPLLLYGAQWWVVSLPSIIIMGFVVARLHYAGLADQVFYMRKLFVLAGCVTVVQTLFGHRLPLVVGPASTLLVGVIASTASGVNAIYTAVLCGGALLAFFAWSGLLPRLRFFFTPRIMAVILMLIAFTLSPTILRLLLPSAGHATFNLCFAAVAVFTLVFCNARLPGIFKSLTVLLGLAGGSLVYFLAQGFPSLPPLAALDDVKTPLFLAALDFDLGALLSFLFCFLALAINELGSIEAVGHMLGADNTGRRLARGAGLQGLANMAAGAFGVVGTVDYSMSAGVIAATGCASRFPLVPAGVLLALSGLFPQAVLLLSRIPSPVMGALMLYLMASQLTGGLTMLLGGKGITDFNSGVTVALPVMVGLITAFAPPAAFDGFPALLRPIVGNGFVMGTVTVIFLEHVVFKRRPEA